MNRIGPMRYYVTVQEKIETVDPVTGVRSESWQDLYQNVPVSVRYLTTNERQEAAARQSEVQVAFEAWASNVPDIKAQHRILYDGKVYELEPPSFHGPQLEFAQIKAAEGLTDG